MGIIHDWGKKVDYSWAIATIYVPFSDSLLPGPLMPHGIVSWTGGGLAGLSISLAANQIYKWVLENWQIFQYKADQSWDRHVIQLSARAVVHVAVGAGFGFGAGYFAIGAGVTVSMGAAAGLAAFVGPQLGRLIYKVALFAYTRIFSGPDELANFKEELSAISKKYVFEGMIRCIFYNVFGNVGEEGQINFCAKENGNEEEQKFNEEFNKRIIVHNITLAFEKGIKAPILDLQENSMLQKYNEFNAITVSNKDTRANINKVYKAAREVLPKVQDRLVQCSEMNNYALKQMGIDITTDIKPRNDSARKLCISIKKNLEILYGFMMRRIFNAALTRDKNNLKDLSTNNAYINSKKIPKKHAEFINHCFTKAREVFF